MLDLIDDSSLPSGSEEDAVHTMLATSDDRVASSLWQQRGGPAIFARQAKRLGLAHTGWGRSGCSTPRAWSV
ncbi:hypothetical protein [Amycolatopsis samaneae]|uniref:Uncharacterized protein n=1 Tax=Amycolatopsis samaneae TaxID=664691 RepID=A0ABW5GW81_9PSEU